MIKKNVWLVALLTTVTLGIYSIYWAAVQRRALLEGPAKGKKIPSWLWLLIPSIVAGAVGVLAFVAIIIIGLAMNADSVQVGIAAGAAFMAVALIPLGFTIWWLVYFGKAVETYTKGRVPRAWSIALYIFIGPYLFLFHQYYINRVGKKLKSKTKKGPTGGFLALAIVLIVLAGLSNAISIIQFPQDVRDAIQSLEANSGVKAEPAQPNKTIEDINKEIDALTAAYYKCIDHLDTVEFPGELTAENEAAYMVGYDKCEDIRREQEELIKSQVPADTTERT